MRAQAALCLLALVACDDGAEQTPGDAAFDAAPDAALDAAPADAAPDAEAPPALMARLVGLWSGPAQDTPLGLFPLMNMDIRSPDGRQIFGRFDRDADNSLRFAFAMEDVDDAPTLVYRNGGFFVGMMRDTRSVLVEQGPDRWRFCHGPRGCEYLEATFEFSAADRMTLTVRVRERLHLRWPARRLEERALPEGFAASSGPHDAPFPPMPALEIRATWRAPLEAPTTVWALISATPCGFTGTCNPARVMSAEAPAGATEAILRIEQMHAGDYALNVILDRNGNFLTRLFPDRGDGIAGLDYEITVAPEGDTTVERPISLNVP